MDEVACRRCGAKIPQTTLVGGKYKAMNIRAYYTCSSCGMENVFTEKDLLRSVVT